MNRRDYEIIKDDALEILSIAQEISEDEKITITDALTAIKIVMIKDLNID